MDSETKQKPNVAVFPSKGMGHLIPFIELTKRLSVCHGFSITFITTGSYGSPREMACTQNLASLGIDIHLVELPPVEIQENNSSAALPALKSKIMDEPVDLLQSLLKNLMNSSSSLICAFITDMFSTETLDVVADLNIPAYIYLTSAAALLSLMLYLPKLISEVGQVSFKDVRAPVKIPGLLPIPATDLPHPIQDRDGERYDWFFRHCFRIQKANGILINTFYDLESKSINALLGGNILSADDSPSIYPIGPILSSPSLESAEVPTVDAEDKANCLKWLDQQPASSVIFVSFGSQATLSEPQIVELALGLEASRQRFLWVVRSPGSSSTVNLADSNISKLLPPRFETRTRDRGLVIHSWAPQISILSHPSTGGFLSHCGWNSTLESISFGVPIIAWPLFAEQRMNAFFLVNEIKVAIEAKPGVDGIVSREEVEKVARELMEGEDGIAMRRRTKELKENAKKAIAQGGTSYNALAEAATVWRKNATAY